MDIPATIFSLLFIIFLFYLIKFCIENSFRLLYSYKKISCPHCRSLLQRSAIWQHFPPTYQYNCTKCGMHYHECSTFYDQYNELSDALDKLNRIRTEHNMTKIKIIPINLAKSVIQSSIDGNSIEKKDQHHKYQHKKSKTLL